jgi:hypothetical protein
MHAIEPCMYPPASVPSSAPLTLAIALPAPCAHFVPIVDAILLAAHILAPTQDSVRIQALNARSLVLIFLAHLRALRMLAGESSCGLQTRGSLDACPSPSCPRMLIPIRPSVCSPIRTGASPRGSLVHPYVRCASLIPLCAASSRRTSSVKSACYTRFLLALINRPL